MDSDSLFQRWMKIHRLYLPDRLIIPLSIRVVMCLRRTPFRIITHRQLMVEIETNMAVLDTIRAEFLRPHDDTAGAEMTGFIPPGFMEIGYGHIDRGMDSAFDKAEKRQERRHEKSAREIAIINDINGSMQILDEQRPILP